MSAGYKTVGWNRNKKIYDAIMWIAIVAYIVMFMLVTGAAYAGDEALSPIIVMMRALSTCAFLMLTLLLCIGPAARLNHRFLPLLYNRRHLGVSTFIIALLHAFLAVFWYHSFGSVNPIESVFTSGGSYDTVSDVPFQAFGAIALVILFLLAATSHDYWNTNLGAPLWKALHMLVYPAWILIVLHVLGGALQADDTGLLPILVVGSVALVGGLHIVAAFRRSGADMTSESTDWVDAGPWRNIKNNRAITIDMGNDERVALFRYDDTKLCAVANACQHQNGPLGDGCVKNGKIVCPWHGYEYRPEDGRSPPPFTEKIETYNVKVEGDHVFVQRKALPRGTERPIIQIKDVTHG